MAPGRILQIFLRGTIQNQIRIAQRVVVDKVVQLCPLRHGHVQRILDPGAVNGNHSPIPEQQLHTAVVLCNKPSEYAQLVLRGEIEHYLSLGCEHGRSEN